jgi:hypothetical protein
MSRARFAWRSIAPFVPSIAACRRFSSAASRLIGTPASDRALRNARTFWPWFKNARPVLSTSCLADRSEACMRRNAHP